MTASGQVDDAPPYGRVFGRPVTLIAHRHRVEMWTDDTVSHGHCSCGRWDESADRADEIVRRWRAHLIGRRG